MARQFYRAGHGISSEHSPSDDLVKKHEKYLRDLVAWYRSTGNPVDRANGDKLESQIPARLKKFATKYRTSSKDADRFGGAEAKKEHERRAHEKADFFVKTGESPTHFTSATTPPVTVGVGNKSKAGSTLASKESTVRAKSSAGATLAGGSTKGRKRR